MNTPPPPLRGLVLAGGRSRRMGRDKAALEQDGRSSLARVVDLLQPLCTSVHVSVRPDQQQEPLRAGFPQIVDLQGASGPAAGIHAAQRHDPRCAWLVVACDLPRLDAATLAHLVAARDPARLATAYRSSHDGLPEPLCAIWEPASATPLAQALADGRHCPRKFLMQSQAGTKLLDLPDPAALDNMNTPGDLVGSGIATPPMRSIHVRYFAVLREQAHRSEETVQTFATTPTELFAELAARHRLTLPRDVLKVSVNASFRDWSHPLQDGDSVVFMPPVAGG